MNKFKGSILKLAPHLFFQALLSLIYVFYVQAESNIFEIVRNLIVDIVSRFDIITTLVLFANLEVQLFLGIPMIW